MKRVLNKKTNKLLYPMQSLMGMVVHFVFVVLRPLVPARFLGKFSNLEKNETLNNVIGLACFNALGGIILMFTNVKIANILGASIFGVYSYYLAIGEVGQNFVRYGRNKSMTRDLIQYPDKYDSLVSNTLAIGLINFSLFLSVVFIFQGKLDVQMTLAAFLLVMAPCVGSLDFQSVYESMREMSWHSMYLFIQRVFFLVAVWACIFASNKLSLSYLGIVLFSSWLFVVICQYWEVIKGFGVKVRKELSLRSISFLYKDNFVIALSTMTGVAFGPVIRMILNEYANSRVVGVYSAGMQIFLISQFLMHQISRVGNPMMAEAGKEGINTVERKELCNKYFLIMLCSVIPFVLPLLLFPQYITDLFYTAEYSELGKYLPFFAIYLIALSLGIVYTQFLISMRKDKTYFAIYIGSALVTILFSFILIPRFSLLGAILALCVPHSIGCLFYYFCSLKYLRS